jgi:hypothetical protein
MAEPITSIVLIDYDNLQRSYLAAGGTGQFADRAGAWLDALGNGRLVEPKGVKRQVEVCRCYAGPSVIGKVRDRLSAAGFDVVDAGDGARGSADLHMAMDTIEALTRPERFGEFILLSPGTELAPLIARLKAAKRTAVILADESTSPKDRAMADVLINVADLVHLPTAHEPANVEVRATPAAAANTGERADIEAFARKIHAATNIPLLSPKTFAELFRTLTEEIAANGYHFQTTAKNVADKMVATGRNVTRRQVVFIVKGLALKGHVFSTSDNAERLAEVFREQARYLIGNAGITLDAREEQLLIAWFQGRPAAATPRAPAPAAAPEAPPALTTVPPSAETRARIAETIEREVAKAVVRPPERSKPQPPRQAVPAAPPPKPQQVKPVGLPKSTARPPQPIRTAPAASAREEAKAVIAARIAASANIKRPVRPTAPQTPVPANTAPSTAPAEPPVAEEQAPPQEARAPNVSPDMLENSILAAIAEAVDVLVDDQPAPPSRGSGRDAPRQQGRAVPAPAEPVEEPDGPTEIDETESSDIGDQIQRIIASYNRNRTE